MSAAMRKREATRPERRSEREVVATYRLRTCRGTWTSKRYERASAFAVQVRPPVRLHASGSANWEQARRQPDAAARAFRTVIDREPNAVERALAPTAGPTPGAHRERIIALLREHAGGIRARGVARLGLFGSTARGDAGDESDIDVVAEIVPGRKFSLIDLAGLRSLLCEMLHRETDVVIRDDLRRRFRARIDEERFGSCNRGAPNRGPGALFDETPETWKNNLNERLRLIRANWFTGGSFIWDSVEEYEPR